MPNLVAIVQEQCRNVRKTAPIVHCITNHVVMNITANALLCTGASPIMAHAAEEMEDIEQLAGALVLNIGTLSPEWISSMFIAGRAANHRGVPVVLDPVGAGASTLRTKTSLRLLEEIKPCILRANASEIMALAGVAAASRGVDSGREVGDAHDSACLLAERHQCVVVISGKTDLVVSPSRRARIHGGHALMPRITGMGCSATSLVAAHAAVADTPFNAALGGMAVMAAAGGEAGLKARGPASFQSLFLDELYDLSDAHIATHVRIEEQT